MFDWFRSNLDLFPLHVPLGAKEQLSKETEELKQSKEELEGRVNALKSQYEGRLLRQDRELRELRETQSQSEPREEPQDQSGSKVHASRHMGSVCQKLISSAAALRCYRATFFNST